MRIREYVHQLFSKLLLILLTHFHILRTAMILTTFCIIWITVFHITTKGFFTQNVA